MDTRQELPVQKKREHETREETTIPARVFLPTADIFEFERRPDGDFGDAGRREK